MLKIYILEIFYKEYTYFSGTLGSKKQNIPAYSVYSPEVTDRNIADRSFGAFCSSSTCINEWQGWLNVTEEVDSWPTVLVSSYMEA